MIKPSAYLIQVKTRQKRNGKYPVKVRIVHQRQYHDFRTGIDMTEEEFEQANSPKPKKMYRELALKLDQIKNNMNQTLSGINNFTFQKFESAFYGVTRKTSELSSIFDEYIDIVRNEGRIKTAQSYQSAANAIKNFAPKASIHDVDARFLKAFHAQLLKEGKSISTIGIYIRTLRAVFNFAIGQGFIKRTDDYPFVRSKYIIPASVNIKKALQPDEIKKILEFPTEEGSYPDRAKDFFLFSYLCNGINFKDLSLLKWKNIDKEMIRFVREKTKRTSISNQRIISCYISPEVQRIIDKWGTTSKALEDYIFDIINKKDSLIDRQKKIDQFIQNTNKNLKRICKAVGIDKPVTSYYCRHSAATALKRAGASILQIQEALGHSSSQVTQKYMDSFEDSTKKDLSLTLLKTIQND